MANSLHVCVTGGAGFIGSHLCRALLLRGHRVTTIDNLSVGRRENVPPGVMLIVGDILDTPLVEEVVSRCDALCHLAARVAVRSSFEFAVEDATANVVGTASVLQAVRAAGTVKRVVSTSSMAVYGEGHPGQPQAESHTTHPASPYGVSKLAAERLTHVMCAQAGVDSAVLRLFNTYGPGQRLSPYVGVATIFMDALRRGDQPIIFGDGEQSRDFVHVTDVAAAFVAAVESPVSGETFNIGSGTPLTVNALLRSIASAMERPYVARYEPAAAGELRYSLADIGKAKAMLGYAPAARFDEAVRELVEEVPCL
jgi:UDP-glucose 4-epimerase